MGTLFVGTSGSAYPAWKPGFYPARLPAAATLAAWVEATPAGFVFAQATEIDQYPTGAYSGLT